MTRMESWPQACFAGPSVFKGSFLPLDIARNSAVLRSQDFKRYSARRRLFCYVCCSITTALTELTAATMSDQDSYYKADLCHAEHQEIQDQVIPSFETLERHRRAANRRKEAIAKTGTSDES